MDPNDKERYLAKAKEAEERAEKAHDESYRASWLRIAAAYHDLAVPKNRTPS